MEIPKGKIVGVLGINGAGKTTTIRMLASIIEPTAGEITMNGIDAVKNHLWVKETFAAKTDSEIENKLRSLNETEITLSDVMKQREGILSNY